MIEGQNLINNTFTNYQYYFKTYLFTKHKRKVKNKVLNILTKCIYRNKEHYLMMARIRTKAKREHIRQQAMFDRIKRYYEKNPRRGLQVLDL